MARPALEGGRLVCADQGGDVLAVLVDGAIVPGLYFISVSRSARDRDLPPRAIRDCQDVRPVARRPDGSPGCSAIASSRSATSPAIGHRCSSRPRKRCGSILRRWERRASWSANSMPADRVAYARCLIRWDQGRLEVVAPRGLFRLPSSSAGSSAQSRSLPPGKLEPRHGPLIGFVQIIEHDGLRFLIDRYNHLVVLDRSGELLCIFYVTRDEVAAWLPDGTCWGSRRLIGGEPTPGAAERIAAVLRSAERGEGRSS